MSCGPKHGDFVWYEINTADAAAAVVFYSALVGWNTPPWGEGGDAMPMFAVGETPIGLFRQHSPRAVAGRCPNHWLGYIAVPDVDATVAQAVALGGKVHVSAMDIPDVGRVAVLMDPAGAGFAVFTAIGEQAHLHDRMIPGQISWHELTTDDVEATWSFYSTLLGWQLVDDVNMGPMGTYRIFKAPESRSLGGIFKRPEGMPAAWVYYVFVADVDAGVAAAKAAGARLVNGPHDVPGGDRVAVLLDPQGAAFALHQGQADG